MPPTRRTDPQRILPGDAPCPVFDVAASRAIETEALAQHPPHALMQAAGKAVARLALAVAPHARTIWVACGPGNNGGDGLVAATELHRAGLAVQATLYGDAARLPADASLALAAAHNAGVRISAALPESTHDLAIDALLGLGATRAPQGAMANAVRHINAGSAPVIAVDLPSGLDANTGQRLGIDTVRATHTLALLTLKPGLFTADARDHAGEVWLDRLGVLESKATPSAWLTGTQDLGPALTRRRHAHHKGSFGDIAIVGGAPGMSGAALLAARAALAAGAGRVFVSLLDGNGPQLDMLHPELMFRPGWWRSPAEVLARSTVVCGCGGGAAVHEVLPALLARCARLVLDADALNALSADTMLRTLLDARAGRGLWTVLTPHPLEAARLLESDAASVQADRFKAARALAQRHQCVVLLKGSGSLIAAPDQTLAINPTGNALLATGGTGDVLAGWLGGLWAPHAHTPDAAHTAYRVAVATAWIHGRAADQVLHAAPHRQSMGAAELLQAMCDCAGIARPGRN